MLCGPRTVSKERYFYEDFILKNLTNTEAAEKTEHSLVGQKIWNFDIFKLVSPLK